MSNLMDHFCCSCSRNQVRYKCQFVRYSIHPSTFVICDYPIEVPFYAAKSPTIILPGIHFLPNMNYNNATLLYDHDLYFSWSYNFVNPNVWIQFGPAQKKWVLVAQTTIEGSGKPAHKRSLARAFAARRHVEETFG